MMFAPPPFRVALGIFLLLAQFVCADDFWNRVGVNWTANHAKVKSLSAQYQVFIEVQGSKTLQSGPFWYFKGTRSFTRVDLSGQAGGQAISTKMLQRGDSIWIGMSGGPLTLSQQWGNPSQGAWGPFSEIGNIIKNENVVFEQETRGIRTYRIQKTVEGKSMAFSMEIDVASLRIVGFQVEQDGARVKKTFGYSVVSGLDVVNSVEVTVSGGKAATYRQVDSWTNIRVNSIVSSETFRVEQ